MAPTRPAGRGPLALDGTVAVVGASLAGLRAVEALRAEGFTGRLVLVGDELHLPYDRPPLSKQVLAGTWPPERTMLADRTRLDELRLEQRLGRRAVSLDAAARRLSLDDGTVIDADGVIVATGAHPRQLPGCQHDAVTVLRTLDQATALRDRLMALGPGARVVVVGAGFIGSEVASTCAGLEARVTVVEALATPLSPVLGTEVGSACGALHRANGVELRTGVGVLGLHPGTAPDGPAGPHPTGEPTGRPPAVEVQLSDGSTLAADVVVVGIGVVPTTNWLEGSGLELGDGVVCDTTLFAADGVVAAGDVARWQWDPDQPDGLVRIEHWQVAAEEGVAAARSLLAGRDAAPRFVTVPYFWSDQYGLRIQVLGRPDSADEVVVVDGSLADERFVALYRRGDRLAAALAISRPRQLMGYRSLLAAGASWTEAVAHSKG